MKRKRDKPCDKESALMADWLSSSSSSKHPQDSQASNSSVSSCQEIIEGNPSHFCHYKNDRF